MTSCEVPEGVESRRAGRTAYHIDDQFHPAITEKDMSYAESTLPEFDHEMAITRKLLERLLESLLD